VLYKAFVCRVVRREVSECQTEEVSVELTLPHHDLGEGRSDELGLARGKRLLYEVTETSVFCTNGHIALSLLPRLHSCKTVTKLEGDLAKQHLVAVLNPRSKEVIDAKLHKPFRNRTTPGALGARKVATASSQSQLRRL
jgi:hypothetical protein